MTPTPLSHRSAVAPAAHAQEGAAAIDIDHLGFALDRRQRRQFGRGQRQRRGEGEGDQVQSSGDYRSRFSRQRDRGKR